MYSEVFEKFDGVFQDFEPFAKASEHGAWETLSEDTRSHLVKMGEEYLNFDFPYLSAKDFLEFSKTGNRVHFEDKMFVKRQALNSLVLAECVEHNGRFTEDIVNGIFSICDESAWFLPAHNGYERNTPQLPLPDATDPVIELFSCETGAVLATACYLLEDELDNFSPFICKRIRYEIAHRIIKPYLNRHFWWMGNGDEPMCNWTPWCTQNVLISTILTGFSDDSELMMKIVSKACYSLDCFLKDYGDDGCCEEGAQYYRHAGLCLMLAQYILDNVTGGYFASIYNDDKFKKIGIYILNMHVSDKYYVNFADCSPVAGRAGSREYLYGKLTGQQNLADFARLEHFQNSERFLPDENNMFYRAMNAFLTDEMLKDLDPQKILISHPDVYYESVGIFIARNTDYTLAVKAGDNNDSHNHNDTGSITLYKNGQPVLIDVGVESYTKKTFSSRRYEIWTMQSDYHNLPTINGCMQKDGAAYRALDVTYSLDDNKFIRMNIAAAYPEEASIRNYIREVALSDDGVYICDCFDDDANVILNFMTYEKPVLDGNIIRVGELAVISDIPNVMPADSNATNVTIETIPITDARLKTCWKHDIYRIRINVSGNSCVKLVIK